MITNHLAALLAALTLASSALAGRPSTDETALRLGVDGWSSRHQQTSQDLKISVDGGTATTTFRTGESGRITLRWEKREGVWELVDDAALTTAAR